MPDSLNIPIGNRDVFENPLHQFSSYSYSIALWWLSIEDYNNLMTRRSVTDALAWSPGSKSYVVAEDSGLYPDRRLPTSLGLNYNINEVKFDSVLTSTYSSNILSGSMTILEPVGCTFVEYLTLHSWNGKQYTNYLQQPYMLEIIFHGYDSNGTPITDNKSNQYMKRIPITLTNWKVSYGTQGTQYQISFVTLSMQGKVSEYNKLPKDITVAKVSTVKEYFDKFAAEINKHYENLTTNNYQGYADVYKFDIDEAIGSSKILYSIESTLKDNDPGSKTLDTDTITITQSANTTIEKVISLVLARSQFFHAQLLRAPKFQRNANESESDYQKRLGPQVISYYERQGESFNGYKVMYNVQYGSTDGPMEEIDQRRGNTRPRIINVVIQQYTTWSGGHPAIGSIPDSTPYILKDYQFTYTGQNLDIVNLNINFDSSYYTNILAYTNQIAAEEDTAAAKKFGAENAEDSPFFVTPQIQALLVSNLNRPVVTNHRFKYQIQDLAKSQGAGISTSPDAMRTADVFATALYSGPAGLALNVHLTIVGDPTLIKQDDVLYVPMTSFSDYLNSAYLSNYEFVSKFGHYRLDVHQAVVTLTLNSGIDYDTGVFGDQATGGIYPPANQSVSLYSGQYFILKISNRFANGKFEQDLTLARYPNSDYAAAKTQYFAQREDGQDLLLSALVSGSSGGAAVDPAVGTYDNQRV